MGEYLNFFPGVPNPDDLYVGVSQHWLVVLSVAVAVFSAYAAFIIENYSESIPSGKVRRTLITLGGIAMGTGIWAMHFIGMVAFDLPGEVAFDPWITALSMLPAVFCSVLVLHFLARRKLGLLGLLFAGLLFGLGVGTMHYTGMAAMEIEGYIRYQPRMFFLSVLVAVALSILALWFRFYMSRIFLKTEVFAIPLSALVMGLAVFGTHHTAMMASYFFKGSSEDSFVLNGSDPHLLVLGVAGVSILITIVILMVVLSETSRQRASNRTLEETDAWYRKMIESAPDGMVVANAEGIMTLVNSKLEQMFGYASGELLGQSIERLVSPDKRANHTSLRKNLITSVLKRNSKEAGIELKGVRKDGTEFPLEIGLARLPEIGRYPESVFASVRDITERKRTQQKILEQRGFLQKMMDTAPVGVAVTANAVVRFANPRIIELVNLKVGDSSQSIYADPKDREAVLNDLATFGYSESKYYKMHGSNGQIRDILASFYATEYQGEPAILGWLIDADKIKAVERDMLRAKEIAEEAANLKSSFLANMSHEIRTPMNAIIGMTHLAMNTELTPRQRDYLNKIRTSGQHLLGVINDILDFSKIEAGKLSIEHIDFDFEKVLENVSTLISEKSLAKGLEIIFDIDRDMPTTFIGDPLRLGQILINYANNAVKFTEKGEIVIIVRIQEIQGDEIVLYLGVRDTGVGLSLEQQSQLFQSFHQTDSSTTRKFGGTGLGLAISKKIAELMGGQVGVQSKLGEGSTFWATVRLGKSNVVPRRMLLSQDLVGRKVLVVDDNENARLVLRGMLEQIKFKVDAVDSGRAALDAIRKADEALVPYELVLLDWEMPGMDGLTVARTVLASQLNHHPHCMMVTAYGREDIVTEAHKLGIDFVVNKPVSASVLFDSIARIFGENVQLSEPSDIYGNSKLSERLRAIRGAKILLVEDNDVNQEVATELLTQAGFVVDLAENGLIAVEKVKSNPYSLVLMDMQMPVMDGLAATVEIRKDLRFAALPIIAMTANVMQSDRDLCTQAGMNDHVSKPIEPDKLWSALLRWIDPLPLEQQQALKEQRIATETVLDESMELLDGVTGLDISAGLRRTLGKANLYFSLLKKFVSGQRDFERSFSQALEQKDVLLAERLAHTLKGVAGNVGAGDIQIAAGRLEMAVKSLASKDELDRLLKEVCSPLNDLLHQLEQKISEKQNYTNALLDTELLEKICDYLSLKLADNDAEAVNYFQLNSGLLKTAFPEQYAALEGSISSFDFDDGLVLLKSAIGSMRGKQE